MDNARVNSAPTFIAGRRWLLVFMLTSALTGCAAFHPIRGVPAPYVPPEFLGPSRSGKKTIDLSLLVQTQPDQYRVAGGDTLSIFIPGVLGTLNIDETQQIGETPPINLSSNPGDPPTIGYPITVRDDGTIALPYVAPINVHGMTLPQIELAIRNAYTRKSNILNGERDRVLVSLQRRREVSVIVVRQETSSELTFGAQPGTLNVGNSKRGTARTVRLPAYENDVLHALANSQQGADGLPGLDAKNTIYIIRRKKQLPERSFDPTLPVPPAISQPDSPPNPAPLNLPQHAAPALPQLPVPPVLDHQPEPVESIPPDASSSTPNDPVRETPSQGISRPETTVPQRIAPPVTPPPVVLPPTPPRSQPADTPTDIPSTQPVESGRAPVWPAPAQPAKSIQRTSGERAVRQAPAVWPQVRSQSPADWPWGHTGPSSTRYGSDATSGYDNTPPPTCDDPAQFGHGAFHPSVASGASTNVQRDQTMLPYSNGGPMAGSWGYPPAMPSQTSPPGDNAAPQQFDPSQFGGHDDAWRGVLAGIDPTVDNPNVIKIPIRLAEGERPTFTERDIILEDGDIVFIESRETEVFYTGGLLGGGQYTLPRDYDLRVLEAISIAQSPRRSNRSIGRAIGGVSALNQDVTISASHVVILRSLPNGTRIPIEVDLYKAVRRPQENILIQPRDLIILQYTKIEAIAALIERHLLEGALFGLASAQFSNPSGGN